MDAIEKLADEQLRELSTDLYVQLEQGTGTRPVLWMLVQAKERAAKAVVMFMDADPFDPKLIQRLQLELSVYDDMVKSCKLLLSLGREAEQRISESDRTALDEIISDMDDEQRRLHNFEPRGTD